MSKALADWVLFDKCAALGFETVSMRREFETACAETVVKTGEEALKAAAQADYKNGGEAVACGSKTRRPFGGEQEKISRRKKR